MYLRQKRDRQGITRVSPGSRDRQCISGRRGTDKVSPGSRGTDNVSQAEE